MINEGNTPEVIYVQENDTSMKYGINQDEDVKGMVKYIREDKIPKEDITAVIRRLSQKQYINVATALKKLDNEIATTTHFLKQKETDYSRGRYEILQDLRKWLIYTCREGEKTVD